MILSLSLLFVVLCGLVACALAAEPSLPNSAQVTSANVAAAAAMPLGSVTVPLQVIDHAPHAIHGNRDSTPTPLTESPGVSSPLTEPRTIERDSDGKQKEGLFRIQRVESARTRELEQEARLEELEREIKRRDLEKDRIKREAKKLERQLELDEINESIQRWQARQAVLKRHMDKKQAEQAKTKPKA